MIIGIPRELRPGESRVAMLPANIATWTAKGIEVLVEPGAGLPAGASDADYEAAGARLVDRDAVFARADVLLQVQAPGANTVNGADDLARLEALDVGKPLAQARAARQGGS